MNAPSESIPSQVIVQPPPYIPPPKPEDRQKLQKYEEILQDTELYLRTHPENEKQPLVDQKQFYSQNIYDPRQNVHQYNNSNFHDPYRISNYQYRNNHNYQTVHMHNAKNQQFYSPTENIDQQCYTLPSRKPQREIEPPRSVTPDITRGLGHGSSLSGISMLAKQGQRTATENEQIPYDSNVELGRRNLEQMEARSRFVQSQPQSVVNIRNR